jgi:hypothetical protein
MTSSGRNATRGIPDLPGIPGIRTLTSRRHIDLLRVCSACSPLL